METIEASEIVYAGAPGAIWKSSFFQLPAPSYQECGFALMVSGW
jgi:hypothetical protein